MSLACWFLSDSHGVTLDFEHIFQLIFTGCTNRGDVLRAIADCFHSFFFSSPFCEIADFESIVLFVAIISLSMAEIYEYFVLYIHILR